jgi:hypothetical protein
MPLKKRYIRNIDTLMNKLGTNENIIRIIRSCIAAWLYGEEIPKYKDLIDEYIPYLKEAYEEQEIIGWENMIRGRWSIKWGEAYNSSQKKEFKEQHITAEKWGKDIIVLTWQLLLDIWKHRNEEEHGTIEEASKIKRNKLIEKILWLNKRNEDYSVEIGKTITKAELETIPIDNLLMMEIQMSSKINDNRKGGQGESQL